MGEQNWAQGWLSAAIGEKHGAWCKVCKISLRTHPNDLQRHANCQSHVDKIRAFNPSLQRQATLPFQSNLTKETDLQLAIYVAMHSSISSVDHLCDILKTVGQGTSLEKLKLYRTKCSKIIKNVLAPCLLIYLILDVGEKPFSLIIDESTDVSVVKYLCCCIKYFSEKDERITTKYLGIVEIASVTADNLYAAVKEYLDRVGLKIQNLIGIGTDGANSLCGRTHSLYTLLQQDVTGLQLVKCVCHSLHNASSKASDVLTSNVEFLCKEIYNWFSNSAKWRAEYRRTYDLINITCNINDEEEKKFHQFVKLSETRWLARTQVIKVILEHWLELKTHFITFVANEKCYTAKLLSQMLQDDSNCMLLVFLKLILMEISAVNILFQKNDIDLSKAYEDLKETWSS